MTGITASLVKELRERTGAGMMDCKRALTETDGDLEEAVAWLRTKGLAAAAQRAGRIAAEGLVAVAVEGARGAVVEVNSETDFVARNEAFQKLAGEVARLALANSGDYEDTAEAAYPGTDRTVGEHITHLVGTIGENLRFRRAALLGVDPGIIASYVHSATAPGMGRIGVLVALESAADPAKLDQLGKQLAMHVAAANPQAVSEDDLDPAIVEGERNVLTEQARESGKPEEVIGKMVEGRLRKFFSEVVLGEQIFVIDNETKVAKVVDDAAAEVGAPIKIAGFLRFELGEGIERKREDFAAEVASQVRG